MRPEALNKIRNFSFECIKFGGFRDVALGAEIINRETDMREEISKHFKFKIQSDFILSP